MSDETCCCNLQTCERHRTLEARCATLESICELKGQSLDNFTGLVRDARRYRLAKSDRYGIAITGEGGCREIYFHDAADAVIDAELKELRT